MGALNEESETHSFLIEKEIKETDEEAKLKIEEEKRYCIELLIEWFSMQGERKNTYDNEETKHEPSQELYEVYVPEHQHYLEKEHPFLIKVDKVITDTDRKSLFRSVGKYESVLSEKLHPVEQSQRASSLNLS